MGETQQEWEKRERRKWIRFGLWAYSLGSLLMAAWGFGALRSHATCDNASFPLIVAGLLLGPFIVVAFTLVFGVWKFLTGDPVILSSIPQFVAAWLRERYTEGPTLVVVLFLCVSAMLYSAFFRYDVYPQDDGNYLYDRLTTSKTFVPTPDCN